MIIVSVVLTTELYAKAPTRTPADTDTYIVMFEAESVVGRLAQKEVESLNLQSLTAQMARHAVQAQQALAMDEMTRVLQRPLSIPYQYTIALNGMAVELTASEAAEIVELSTVHAVVPSQTRYPQSDAGPTWIGAPSLWDGSQTGGIPGTLGEGSIIGIIDTGINLDHPSFAAVGGDGYGHTNPNGAGNYLGKCATQPEISICNDKLIGAYSWPQTGDNPEDDFGTGHGSNVAGIAAGNIITAVYTAPTTVLTATLSGVAPHANIIA
jgi:subtilisin family serine protease